MRCSSLLPGGLNPSGSTLRQSLAGHALAVRQAFLLADGERLVSVSDDAVGILWDCAAAAQVLRYEGGHGSAIKLASITEQEHLLATGSTGEQPDENE